MTAYAKDNLEIFVINFKITVITRVINMEKICANKKNI